MKSLSSNLHFTGPLRTLTETTTMEVHHHTHAPQGKKSWKAYFWEFLMLFLAVFCGFLAEYQLEHVIEHQREKEYMETMLEDLKSDTALLKYAVQYWSAINNDIDSVTDAIQMQGTRSDLRKAYRHLPEATDFFSFSYNDRTIAQLKNAGGFRLLRNRRVANSIIAYDQFNNDAIRNIAEQHGLFFETMVKLRNKVFSQGIHNAIYDRYHYHAVPDSANAWLDSLIKNDQVPIPEAALVPLMFEFKNALLAYRQDFTNMKWGYDKLLKDQEALIELISKEYHIK